MSLLRVRVELADVPGALAAATTVLAALGVDVVSVDVLEVDARTVVDELVLRLPDGLARQEVVDALRLAGAVDVLSVRPDATAADPVVRALELAAAALDGDPGAALAAVAYADVGRLMTAAEAVEHPLSARALEQGVPASGRAGPQGPVDLRRGWVLCVAAQGPGGQPVAAVGRRLDVRFSATEAARLRALTTLLSHAQTAAPPAASGPGAVQVG